jgi:uncharacterized damage-inducible protein DinB
MKDSLLMYARYGKRADASVMALLDGLDSAAREQDRKSHYGSLSELARHVLDGTLYFHSLFRASCPPIPAVRDILKKTEGLKVPKGKLSDAEWAAFKALLEAADDATVELATVMGEAGTSHPIALDWYDGKPPAVPYQFMFNQLVVHGIHHRGQISQILDELGVEHDFSGIDLEFLD